MIFIDCGFYVGNALKIYMEKGIVDESWTVYAFEPSPELEVEKRIEDFFPGMNIQLIKKAVWTKDGSVSFQIGGRNDASSIKGTSGHGDPRIITVPSMDFSKFVSELDGFIICSMDIEGAEFSVLEKMLTEDTISKIDLLDVEFHHRLMLEKDQDDAQKIIDQLITKTAVKLKVGLN